MLIKKLTAKALATALTVAICFQAFGLNVKAKELEIAEVLSEVVSDVVITDDEASEEVVLSEVVSEEVVSEEVVSEEEVSVVETSSTYVGDNFTVDFKVDGMWDGGFNASVVITNNSDEVIHDWILVYDTEYQFNTVWNAIDYDLEGKTSSFKNAGWNQDILPGSSVSFGFQGSGEFLGCPTAYEILGTCEENSKEDYSVEYILDTDWGTGFSGRVIVTNLTEETLEDWFIEFDFARNITSIWNAVILDQDGNHYSLKNADYNCNIAPGQSISFGFLGENGLASDVPENYVLSTYTPSAPEELVKIAFGIKDTQVERAEKGQIVIARVDEATGEKTILETSYDEETKEVYTYVPESLKDDKYVVLDLVEIYNSISPSFKSSVFTTNEVDVILVIDGTASMSSMISSVKASIKNLDVVLKGAGIVPRYGLVEYGDFQNTEKSNKPLPETTLFYGWFTSGEDAANELTKRKSPIYYGGDRAETALDGLYVGMNLEMREAAHQYMILVTDADYKNGIEGNLSYNMSDCISDIIDNGVVTSIVLNGKDYESYYTELASKTKGVISTSYTTTKLNNTDSMTQNLIKHVSEDCWVRLADSTIVKLDKDPSLGDNSIDTDKDGIPDLQELCEIVVIPVINPYTMETEYFEAWTYVSNPIK